MTAIEDLTRLGLTPILGLVFLVFVVGKGIQRRYLSPISDIPGPFLASFSVLWSIWHLIKGHGEEAIVSLHRKHGNFVRISYKEVSISHPDAVRLVLAAPIRKADYYKVFALPDHNYENLMSEVDPKRHVAQAKNVMSGYAMSNVVKSEPFVDNTILLFEERMDQLSKAKASVEFDKWFNYLAFDIMGEVTFSSRFGFLDEGRDIRNAIANTTILSLYIGIMGHVRWLHALLLANPIVQWLDFAPSQHIFGTCLAAVENRKRNTNSRTDMMEQWMMTRKKFPERMQEKEILTSAVANIGAGADSVSATLQAFVYHLLRSPKRLSRLRDEIDSAQARGDLSKVVSFAEAQKLPYLQACIKETYRFHTGVSFNLPRVVPEEGIVIAGHRFTEGTILSIHPWVMHRNVECFGQDVDGFVPERWLDFDRSKMMEKYMIQFGTGYNTCLGRHLAQFEISKITATLIRDFDIRQVEEGKEWAFKSRITAMPYGWPCYITRRQVTDQPLQNAHPTPINPKDE